MIQNYFRVDLVDMTGSQTPCDYLSLIERPRGSASVSAHFQCAPVQVNGMFIYNISVKLLMQNKCDEPAARVFADVLTFQQVFCLQWSFLTPAPVHWREAEIPETEEFPRPDCLSFPPNSHDRRGAVGAQRRTVSFLADVAPKYVKNYKKIGEQTAPTKTRSDFSVCVTEAWCNIHTIRAAGARYWSKSINVIRPFD